MSSITSQLPDLQTSGPNIEVWLGPSDNLVKVLQASGQPVPPPVSVTAQIDTGAQTTVFSPAVLGRLGLAPVGAMNIVTPSTSGGGHPCMLYDVAIRFPGHRIHARNWRVIEAPLGGQAIDGLIGRDILAHAILIYIGNQNQFTLSF